MNRCVCLGLGAYVDGDGVSEGLRVSPCEYHPLPLEEADTPDGAAGLRVDQCLEALARLRDLLWPDQAAMPAGPAARVEQIAEVLDFLRPASTTKPAGTPTAKLGATVDLAVVLEIEGDPATALHVVNEVLDAGVLQDAINDYETDDGPVRVESATVEYAR